MLKSVYGFLFTDQEQANRPVPTIDQVFLGIDVKKTPVEIQPQPQPQPQIQIQDQSQFTHQQLSPPPVQSFTQKTSTSTLVWSASEKKWVKDNSVLAEVVTVEPGVEIVRAKVVETIQKKVSENQLVETIPIQQQQLAIKPVQSIGEFKANITEHIITQRQKQTEKLHREELAKIEKPKRTLKQWAPNDELVKAHDAAAEAVGKVPNLLKKIKQHQEKIKTKQTDVDKIQNKKDLNPFDRFELLDYRKDIVAEEGKISEIELHLEQAQRYIDDPIFEEFALYLVEAEQYIKDAELIGIMNANDILTSEAIYIKTKSLMDSLKYGKKNPILMERLQYISESFNMSSVHENSRGKNLREFKNFFIADKVDNPLYIFDKMDETALIDTRIKDADGIERMRSAIQDAQDRLLPPNDLTGISPVIFGSDGLNSVSFN